LVADLAKQEPLDLRDARYDSYSIHAIDERWTRELLADHPARGALLRLMAEESAYELRQVLIQPQALVLRLRHIHLEDVTAENVRAWLDALFDLLRATENISPARVTALETSLERTNRLNRSKYVWPIVGVTCGFFALMTICILAIVGVLIYFENTGF
jgi:hypothetical protein